MIKQTQTKMFDFSDVGLDICPASKNLFQDRFKKIFENGYNTQPVSSFSILSQTQIVLTYLNPHGYVKDRILQVNADGGFKKEVYIDSVTSTTVTCTVLDSDTGGLSGNVSTYISPLGWNLIYEKNNVQIYKILDFYDDSDLFLRLCFQDNAEYKNAVSPCIGRSCDLDLGIIDDENALNSTKSVTTPVIDFAWVFSALAQSTMNNYTYANGLSTFGSFKVVGSKYHVVFSMNTYVGGGDCRIYGFVPYVGNKISEKLNYPIIIGDINSGRPMNSNGSTAPLTTYTSGLTYTYYLGMIGNYQVTFRELTSSDYATFYTNYNQSVQNASYLPANLDSNNVTTAKMLDVYLRDSGQHLGVTPFLFQPMYARSSGRPTFTLATLAQETVDADYNNRLLICCIGDISGSNSQSIICIPIEQVKYGN